MGLMSRIFEGLNAFGEWVDCAFRDLIIYDPWGDDFREKIEDTARTHTELSVIDPHNLLLRLATVNPSGRGLSLDTSFFDRYGHPTSIGGLSEHMDRYIQYHSDLRGAIDATEKDCTA